MNVLFLVLLSADSISYIKQLCKLTSNSNSNEMHCLARNQQNPIILTIIRFTGGPHFQEGHGHRLHSTKVESFESLGKLQSSL